MATHRQNLTRSFAGDVLQKEPKRGDMQTGERGRLRYHRESFQMGALMLLLTCIAASCSNTKVAGLNQHKQYSPSEFFQPFGEPIPAGGLLPIQSGANQ